MEMDAVLSGRVHGETLAALKPVLSMRLGVAAGASLFHRGKIV
jgi:hypothetical protein